MQPKLCSESCSITAFLHREVGTDEVLYVFGPESQDGPLATQTHDRDPGDCGA